MRYNKLNYYHQCYVIFIESTSVDSLFFVKRILSVYNIKSKGIYLLEGIVNGPSIYFLGITTSITLGIAYLFFVLLSKVFPCYNKRNLKLIYWLINFTTIIVGVVLRGRVEVLPFASTLTRILIVWFMMQLFGLLMLPIYYGMKKLYVQKLMKPGSEVDRTRRKLIQGAAISLPIMSIGLSSYGTFFGAEKVEILEHELVVPNLDKEIGGLKIAQISDAHIGLFFSVEKLAGLLNIVQEKGADVVVITGDLIDDVQAVDRLIQVLDAYVPKFPKDIYFSWGNHEYFRDFARLEKAFARSAVAVLRNSNTLLIDSLKPVYLLGVDYPWGDKATEQVAKSKEMIDLALQGVPKNATKILLSHHPVVIDYAYEQKIDLTLTGHTHGGQIAFGRQSILPVRYKYMRGMYRKADMYGYVSTGAGSWFPFRLGCPAEVSLFTLKPAKDEKE